MVRGHHARLRHQVLDILPVFQVDNVLHRLPEIRQALVRQFQSVFLDDVWDFDVAAHLGRQHDRILLV